MAYVTRAKPPREIRAVKKVRVNRWVKAKPEEGDELKSFKKPKKYLQESVVERVGVMTRCCTKCGFSDLDCAC